MLPWQHECFNFFSKDTAVGLRNPIKQYSLICQRFEKVISWRSLICLQKTVEKMLKMETEADVNKRKEERKWLMLKQYKPIIALFLFEGKNINHIKRH